jgi:hypothetical protein
MKLCMFSPRELGLERGWPGGVDGERVIQLAAQTLQAFFAGGGDAREHAEYPLVDVVLRAPVLHPPSVRLFESAEEFAFANPAAIIGPGDPVPALGDLEVHARLAAVVALDAIGGFTLMAEIRAPELGPPKDRDFALALGPVVETELETDFDFDAALAFAARNTRLYPGDLLAAPAHEVVAAGEVSYEGIGTLRNPVTN